MVSPYILAFTYGWKQKSISINFEHFYTSWTKNMIFDPLSKENFDKGSPYISFSPQNSWKKKKKHLWAI
jgi:hypothetical protein